MIRTGSWWNAEAHAGPASPNHFRRPGLGFPAGIIWFLLAGRRAGDCALIPLRLFHNATFGLSSLLNFIIGTPILTAAALVMGLALRVDTALWVPGVIAMFFGTGLGFCMQPLTLAMQLSVPGRDMGVGTSSAAFFRSMGGAVVTADPANAQLFRLFQDGARS